MYRRFPNLTRLLVRAVEWECRNSKGPDSDAESLPGWPDVDAMVTVWAEQLSDPHTRRLTRRLYGTLDDLPELLQAYNNAHGARHGRAVRATLEHARATGRLPSSTDPDLLQQVLSGAALQHLAVHPDDARAEDIKAYFLGILRQAGLSADTSGSRRSTEC